MVCAARWHSLVTRVNLFFFFQAEDGIRDLTVTGVQTCALPISIVKVASLWTSRPQLPSADVTTRLEALERSVEHLQQEQAETQERLDFAERLLSKAREERRICR